MPECYIVVTFEPLRVLRIRADHGERRNMPTSSEITKSARKMKNRTLAISAAPTAMPVKPNTAAISAMTKNTAAYCNMENLRSRVSEGEAGLERDASFVERGGQPEAAEAIRVRLEIARRIRIAADRFEQHPVLGRGQRARIAQRYRIRRRRNGGVLMRVPHSSS